MIQDEGRDGSGRPGEFGGGPEGSSAAQRDELRRVIELASNHPVTTAVLNSCRMLLAVLTSDRHIVALNRRLAGQLGLGESDLGRGLRPGAALGCVRRAEAPGGCGTGALCTECGITRVLATVEGGDEAAEAECLLCTRRSGSLEPREFMARASTVDVEGARFTVLSLEDIAERQRRDALERVFLHDVLNGLQTLTAGIDLLRLTDPAGAETLVARLERAVARTTREVVAQRDFALLDRGDYVPVTRRIPLEELLATLRDIFGDHPVARDRALRIEPPPHPLHLVTDRTLVERVLENMVKNALEATEPGGTVRVWAVADLARVRLSVWNDSAIPEAIARRVFQRYHSTKDGAGRGLGTYGMKLLGERYLGGAVGFRSADEEGTTFYLDLPRTT